MFKKLKTHVIVILSFLIISVLYFTPEIFQGKKLYQYDSIHYLGVSKEIRDAKNIYGREALWTNRVFSGMPSYVISSGYFKNNKISIFHKILTINDWRPVCFLFLYLLGFYIACLLFNLNPWIALIGSIAYAFSSYFLIIIEAGHNTKAFALGYMPPIIAGVYSAFRGNIVFGSLISGIFLALQIYVSHPQITYYTLLIILVLGIIELIYSIKKKYFKKILFACIALFVVYLIAIGANFSRIIVLNEYSKYSIRGKSDLTQTKENKSKGLDLDYATQWSLGIDETLSLLVPNIKGAPASFNEKSKTYSFLRKVTNNPSEVIKSLPSYWGKQPFTTPVYAGAIICFLAILGLFVLDKKYKWWLFSIIVISLFMSWGKNLMFFTEFLFKFLPGYNKFRAVSMALIIAEFALPLIAALTLFNIVFNEKINKEVLKKYLNYSFYIVGGLLLILIIFPSLFGLNSLYDEKYIDMGYGNLVDLMIEDRKSLLRADAFRSLVFVVIAYSLIYIFINKKIKTEFILTLLGVFILIDLWAVDKRYLNKDNFVSKKEIKEPFKPSFANNYILENAKPGERVLNLAVGDPFRDASTSYFHNSIGGYSAAKIKRYQELIDFHLIKEMQILLNILNQKPSYERIDSIFANLNAFNMLNTRFIIFNLETYPLINKYAAGNAWFVENIKIVENADQEIAELDKIDLKREVLIDKKFSEIFRNFNPVKDTLAKIELIEYQPEYLKYKSNTNKPQFVVFSEIYYDKGWDAYIDGKKTNYVRCNYVLRGMIIPEGQHIIEFKFYPKSFYFGEKVSLASSVILIVLFIGSLVYSIINLKKNE